MLPKGANKGESQNLNLLILHPILMQFFAKGTILLVIDE